MNTYLVVTVCLSVLAVLSDGVEVKVGDFTFPLESVKQLDSFLKERSKNMRMRMSMSSTFGVCRDEQLPAEFVPLCASPKAGTMFRQLEMIAANPVTCEICANVACSGC